MGKILSTNLLTYNGYNSSRHSNKILSVPKKIDYTVRQVPGESAFLPVLTYGTAIWEDFINNYVNYIPEIPSSWEGQWELNPEDIVIHTDSTTGGAILECYYTEKTGPTEFEMITLDSGQKASVLNAYTDSVIPAMNSLGYNQYAYQPNASRGINALLQGDNGNRYGMAAATTDWSTFYYVPFELDPYFVFIKIGTPDTAPTGSSPNYYNIIYVFGENGPQSWAISSIVDGVTTVNELGGYIAGLLGY